MSPTNEIYDQANLDVFYSFFHGLNIIAYIQFLKIISFKIHVR